MKKTKAKRITKQSNPTESLQVDDPLVKWELDCANPGKFEDESLVAKSSYVDSSPTVAEHEILTRDLRVGHSQIQQL